MVIRWEEYGTPNGVVDWIGDDILALYDIGIWIPPDIPSGQWQVNIIQNNNTFNIPSSDFRISQIDRPYVNVISSIPATATTPTEAGYPNARIVRPKSNGKMDLVGDGFSPNTLVYIPVYQSEDFHFSHLILKSKLAVFSNSKGSISVELPGPFYPASYVVFGISDPNRTITLAPNDPTFDSSLPFDFFLVESTTSTVNSCPGAPPQRMILSQRGYVCTQSDRVRLRNVPAKSADTIVYVNTGTQFTVIGGPSCSDNWSWWNVRLDDGTMGWLAEGGDAVDQYFICPLP